MTMFLKAAFHQPVPTTFTKNGIQTTRCGTENFKDIQLSRQVGGALLIVDCGLTFFTMALGGVHDGTPGFLWEALEAYFRHMAKKVQVSNPLFVKHPFTSNACLGCFQVVESAGIFDPSSIDKVQTQPISCDSRLPLSLGLGFCLNLSIFIASGVTIYQESFWERGGWLGICLIISRAILGVEIFISYFPLYFLMLVI